MGRSLTMKLCNTAVAGPMGDDQIHLDSVVRRLPWEVPEAAYDVNAVTHSHSAAVLERLTSVRLRTHFAMLLPFEDIVLTAHHAAEYQNVFV